ncbi:MAG: DUF202 domain-containing protein [Abditibacteriaceae bacterium]
MPDDEIKTQLDGARKLVELAQIRNNQSAQRNYQNAERTLSVWIRTSIGAMIFGIAIDRLGLMAYQIPKQASSHLVAPDVPSMVIGVVLVIYSIVMALACGVRFLAYARDYKKQYPQPAYHSEWPPVISAFLVAIFGAALLLFMIWFR